jgi:hypothetical protein
MFGGWIKKLVITKLLTFSIFWRNMMLAEKSGCVHWTQSETPRSCTSLGFLFPFEEE